MGIVRVSTLLLAGLLAAAGAAGEEPGWSRYGANAAGHRYSPLDQINRDNVDALEVAWRYSTGELARRGDAMITNSSTQVTPILAAGSLVFCTPFNRIIALDPATGAERWVFDAEVDEGFELPYQYSCRGVSYWRDATAGEDAACAERIFMGTVDTRLIAVDARTGNACAGFGKDGQVQVEAAWPDRFTGERKLIAAPMVLGDRVIVGSSIMDNLRTDAPPGTVFAFDARSGEELWRFEPVPRSPEDPAWKSWGEGSAARTGAGNVWSTGVVDVQRDLVFLPVGSAAPDFWGGERPGNNLYTSSLVALDGATGAVRWHFQHVHHDIWDYDTSSPPLLVDLEGDGERVPAVVQNTKQGFVFVLHRETGEPLHPVEERPVPQGALDGEWLSSTQPFPVRPPPLVPTRVTPEDAWGFTPFDRRACRKKLEALRSEGIYTPPSTAPGTLLTPGSAGGANWGGPAWDPASGLMYINVNTVPQVVILIPREEIPGVDGISLASGTDVSAMAGTPYGVRREWLLSPLGAPCTAPPWGELIAVDVAKGTIAWRRNLGSIENYVPLMRLQWELGTPNLGGPVVTAGGLVFIGATMDERFRAFDARTGEVLWNQKMKAGLQTTPMTYEAEGRQYVVIATGHHLWFGSPRGDEVVAFALPKN